MVREELVMWFEDVDHYDIDELDFCMELIEEGVTVEIVREYVGDSQAEWMETFAIEHGLM